MRRLRQVRGGVPGYHNYTGGESPMKKRWYDFLWIASLLYLVLGFFNILFAWLGLLCFFILWSSPLRAGIRLLQPLLWTGTVVQPAGWTLRPLPAGRYSPVDEKQGVPLRVFGLFSADVLPDALEHISGLCRRAGAAPGRHSALDVPAALALGLLWNPLFPRRCPIRLWLLQRMLTSTVLGLVTMVLFKPRSWCVYCPMGTMTQLICRGKHRGGGRPPLPGRR